MTLPALLLLFSCYLVKGVKSDLNLTFHQSSEIFFDQDFQDENILKNYTGDNSLPVALPQTGPQPRNYVAYIPVPISDDEDGGDDEEEDESYEESEYYEDDEYYDEEEDEPPPPPKRRPRPTRKRPDRKVKYHPNRRKDEESDSERIPFLVPLMMVPESEIGLDNKFSFAGDQLVNKNEQVNSFNRDSLFTARPVNSNRPFSRPQSNRRNLFQNSNINNGPRRLFSPNRRVTSNFEDMPALHKKPGPPYPGPNPRAPNKPLDTTIIHPSNQYPLYQRPDSVGLGSDLEEDVEVIYVEPVDTSPSTTTTTTTTTKAPTVIVLQQNPYPPPYNMYPQNQMYPNSYNNYPPTYPYSNQYQYQHHPVTEVTTTTTTTTTTATTTTEKPKKRRKKKKKPTLEYSPITYQNMEPDVLIDGILPPEPPNKRPLGPSLSSMLETNLISKRAGLSSSNIINHVVPAPTSITGRRFNNNWRMRRRLRNPGLYNQNQLPEQYITGNSNVRPNYNNRRYSFDRNGVQGTIQEEFDDAFANLPQTPPRVQNNVPNVFSQGHPGSPETINSALPQHTIYVNPPMTTTYKPPVIRPPPRHPGVRIPGVQHPPDSGSIQDILDTIEPNRRRYSSPSYSPPPKQQSYEESHKAVLPGYRPPIGHNKYGEYNGPTYNPESNTYHESKPTYNYEPALVENHFIQYQEPEANYRPAVYETPSKVPNLTPQEPQYSPPQHGYNNQQQTYNQLQPSYNPPPQQQPSYNPHKPNQVQSNYIPSSPHQEPNYNNPSNHNQLLPSYNPPPQESSYQHNPSVIPSVQQGQNPGYSYPYSYGSDISDGKGINYPQRDAEANSYHPASNYGISKISIAEPQPTPERIPYQGNSHFFNEVNKMQPILLNENQGQSNRFYSVDSYQQPQTTTPAPNYINLNAVNSFTSLGLGQSHTFTKVPSLGNNQRFGSGLPTGGYDPNRPDGPDYSTATDTLTKTTGLRGQSLAGIPLNIGLDVYPIQGEKSSNKRTSYASTDSDSLHQVKLHLNLFPSKPHRDKGSSAESFSIGPFTYNQNGRQRPADSYESRAKEISSDPIFGKLNPVTIFNYLLKSKPPTGSDLMSNATLVNSSDRRDDKISNHKLANYATSTYSTTTSTPRPTTTYAAEASEVDSHAYYNQQQIDRLGHEYEYYEYDSNDDAEEAKEPEEQEYEYYYTYSYEYVDPDQLQYERLPRPSFQGGKSKKEE